MKSIRRTDTTDLKFLYFHVCIRMFVFSQINRISCIAVISYLSSTHFNIQPTNPTPKPISQAQTK